jgi:hypothetical protein
MRSIRVPIEGTFISGTLIPSHRPEERSPGLLFVHGWGSSEHSYLQVARHLARLGFVCLTLNLRGHHETRHQQDEVSRADSLKDVLAAYDLLAAEPGVDPGRLGVAGSSYGGYLAAILPTRRPVRWLALRAPALYKDEGFEQPKRVAHRDPEELAAFRRRVVAPHESIALRSASHFHGDVLLVQSENDTTIPAPVLESYRQAFQAARSLTHITIPGVDHGLSRPSWRRQYNAVLVQWFKALREDHSWLEALEPPPWRPEATP